MGIGRSASSPRKTFAAISSNRISLLDYGVSGRNHTGQGASGSFPVSRSSARTAPPCFPERSSTGGISKRSATRPPYACVRGHGIIAYNRRAKEVSDVLESSICNGIALPRVKHHHFFGCSPANSVPRYLHLLDRVAYLPETSDKAHCEGGDCSAHSSSPFVRPKSVFHFGRIQGTTPIPRPVVRPDAPRPLKHLRYPSGNTL